MFGYVLKEIKLGFYIDLIMCSESLIIVNFDFVEGMKYLFDCEQICLVVFCGYVVIGNDQLILLGYCYFNVLLLQWLYDLDKVKFLFQKVGVFGMVLLLIYVMFDVNGLIEMVVLLQQVGQKIGLNLQVNCVLFDGYWLNYWMKYLFGFGNINLCLSVDVLFMQFFKLDVVWNELGWKNVKFDQLLFVVCLEIDDVKCKQMYGEMQMFVVQQGWVGILVFISFFDGYDKWFVGFGLILIGGMMGFMFVEYVWWNV